MTAIAAVVDEGKVWIGADSAATNVYFQQNIRSDSKVFRNGTFLFGFCGSVRIWQVAEYVFSPPQRFEQESTIEYLVTRFIPELKRVFQLSGVQTEENGEHGFCGSFLLGHRQELFCIECDYQVARVTSNFNAIGCGSDLVLGSLHTTEQYMIPAKERIKLALTTAAEFSAGVRGPFNIESI